MKKVENVESNVVDVEFIAKVEELSFDAQCGEGYHWETDWVNFPILGGTCRPNPTSPISGSGGFSY